MPQLLSPAGDFSMLAAAIKAGADAVYFGVRGLNMRAAASNFSLAEARKVIAIAHKNNVKAYCTINVIIYEKELSSLSKTLASLKKSRVDAVICWDLAVVKKCKELGIPIHLSTQASVSNSEAALYWKKLGIKRIVLARECSLEDVKDLKKKTGLEIEVFVHGARCISLSGRCFMSQELFGKSANRGECLQPCRRDYLVTDEEGKQMKLENNFVLSAKDLCALPLLPKILSTGADSLKIEGRNRGAEYVFKATKVYREAVTAIKLKKFNEELIKKLTETLTEVYNKDFSAGFLVDYPHHQRCNVYGSKATIEKVQLGKVTNFYRNKSVAEFKIESEEIKVGDKLAFVGPTTGYVEVEVQEMYTDKGKCTQAGKGIIVAVAVPQKVRENDRVYVVKKRNN
ncbi:U32 family peptidase [Candidatus Woesearchaeota archaeon]|nr:U32 family peptidase [Candidatus Woesearchaeota archaeon]